MKRLNKSVIIMAIGVVIAILFETLNIYIKELNFEFSKNVKYEILMCLCICLVTYLGYQIASEINHRTNKLQAIQFYNVSKVVSRLCCTVAIFFFIGPGLDIYYRLGFTIGFRFFFLYTYLVFPYICGLIEKEVKTNGKTNYIAVIKMVLCSNLIAFMCLYETEIKYIVMIAIIQVLSVIRLIFVLEKQNISRKLLGSMLYIIWWVVGIGIYVNHHSVYYINLSIEIKEYMPQIIYLLKNASLVGSNTILAESSTLREAMTLDVNPIHTLLYNFGWFAASIYLVLLCILLVVLYICLGTKYKQHKSFYYVYETIYVHFLIHSILGCFYSFGFGILPISLPFSGSLSDICLFILMLFSQYENICIESRLSESN